GERKTAQTLQPARVSVTRGNIRAYIGIRRVRQRESEGGSQIDEDFPIVSRLAGRRNRPCRSLQPALVVAIRRFLLDRRCTRENEIGRSRERREQNALDDQQRQSAAEARVHDPLRLSDRPVW